MSSTFVIAADQTTYSISSRSGPDSSLLADDGTPGDLPRAQHTGVDVSCGAGILAVEST